MRFPSTNHIRKLLLIALALGWLLASIENSAPSVQAQSGDIFVFDDVIDNSIGANALALVFLRGIWRRYHNATPKD